MDRVKVTLTKALGEKAASDFIQAALAVQDPQEIKKRVCKLLDTRKQENRHVYEILMKEKLRRDAFPHEGYRKSDTYPNAPVNSDIGPVENEASFVEKTKHSEAQNTNKSKRKLKFYPLFSEGARGEELVAHLPGRHPCQCLATKHQLINNCTYCGRIVCTQEGSGPCYFCGHLVCSKEEKQIIGLGTKQALKLQNRLLQVPWAPGTEEPLYRVRKRAAKVAVAAAWKKKELPLDSTDKISPEVGDYLPGTGDEYMDAADELEAYTPVTGAQQRLEEGLAAALANRDRLLEYDASSARRTRVLDDEMDYFVSEGAGGASVWLSPEARDRVQKRVSELRAQRHASRLETMRFCLDFAGREIIPEDTRDEAARQLYNPTQTEIGEWVSTIRSTPPPSTCTRQEADNEFSRITDPTLGIKGLKYVKSESAEQTKSESNQEDRNPLVSALHQPLVKLRLQDDSSRQLTDEGYCLSMHQPWASFLVRGNKKDEGRVWYSTHRGPLWIASTVKTPDSAIIEAVEKEYIASGGSRNDLPTSYPTGCLLGRVNVVDVLSQEQYRAKFPYGTSTSPFVFICDDPREVLLKFPVSGKHKIYKLDPHLHTAASKNLA